MREAWDILVAFASDAIVGFADVGGGFGLGIILLTLALRALMAPLVHFGLVTQLLLGRQQKATKPGADILRARFKDDFVQQQEELTRYFREHHFNPLDAFKSLGVVLIQVALLLVMYFAIVGLEALSGASFLWIDDLSQADAVVSLGFSLPYFGASVGALPVIAAATQWVTAIFVAEANTGYRKWFRPSYATFPLAMLIVSNPLPAALVLFWAVGNIAQAGQQWWVTQRHPCPLSQRKRPAPSEWVHALFGAVRLNLSLGKDSPLLCYVEGRHIWPHLQGLCRELSRRGLRGTLITSERRALSEEEMPAGWQQRFVGSGAIRSLVFRFLRGRVLVSSTPDLDTFQLKRSFFKLHYVYVHHSLVSISMIYRYGAFDSFDTILCAGPHQKQEHEWRAEQIGRAQRCVPHGYERLDLLRAELSNANEPVAPDQVLVAPSWGPHGLLENHALALTESLLAANLRVIVRPHPQTVRLRPDVIDELNTHYGKHERFLLETDMAASNSFRTSALMVSDWSGAALEFGLATARPVLFVDVPRKINNPAYDEFPNQPLEVSVREQLGGVLSAADIRYAGTRAATLLGAGTKPGAPQGPAADILYNPGRAAHMGANVMVELICDEGEGLASAPHQLHRPSLDAPPKEASGDEERRRQA